MFGDGMGYDVDDEYVLSKVCLVTVYILNGKFV